MAIGDEVQYYMHCGEKRGKYFDNRHIIIGSHQQQSRISYS